MCVCVWFAESAEALPLAATYVIIGGGPTAFFAIRGIMDRDKNAKVLAIVAASVVAASVVAASVVAAATDAHTYTHIHAHIHAHIHTDTQAHTHTYTHIHAHIHTHIHTYTCMHTSNVYTHTCFCSCCSAL